MINKPVWIDTDTGVDDAFALLTAIKLPGLDIKGISAVHGNVELDKTFINARNVLSLGKREDIKVYKGLADPFKVEHHYAYNVHGEDGLGGAIIQESKASIETKNAIEAMYECAKECGKLYIAAVGPLTNIAAAIINYPDFLDYVEEIDIMGGSVGVGGNTTTAAEFNIYGDPHAAQTVFMSGAKINLFPLDVTMKSVLFEDEVKSIGNKKTKVSDFLTYSANFPMDLYNSLGLGRILCLHDTCPLVYMSDSTLFSGKEAGVYVETQAQLSLGRTVSDIFVKADVMFEKNMKVFLEVDREKLAKIVLDSYNQFDD